MPSRWETLIYESSLLSAAIVVQAFLYRQQPFASDHKIIFWV